ncbi:PAP2 superfamily-domain-containing protein [Tricharina praecox]|uniref:PAP2 superfamily-domain-containing protein n=1 Tax=Tricharina praecox TaxID=43433 RepID=UPI00221EEEF5|nr:PAP2 superfamily-domain-containing protein [Tricharina praecox]KAI5857518.1 PAP2 superfamily-domain-containing protein [Tricharina praecox]
MDSTFGTTATTTTPTPLASAPPEWGSDPAWKLPGWAEPVIVASILFGACFYTRRRNFNVSGKQSSRYALLDQDSNSSQDTIGQDETLKYEEDDTDSDYFATTSKHASSKRRPFCGTTILTPNTSQFANNWHSRMLYKFPFFIEMFYWIVTYFVYRLTHIMSQALFSDSIWDLAQSHGLAILEFEQFSIFRFFFPVPELSVQHWFLEGHAELLTFFNKAYALIHIPGTVYFMAWYYYAAPNHAIFAKVRRTMTLCNLTAFAIFTSYPCMPPRLLPKEYGFVDTVRRDDAESVWMSGKFVNHLAAMPSMHFGYAFIIGTTCLYHAGAFRWAGLGYENRSAKIWKWSLCVFGVLYPLGILTTIVATANHYYLDAVVAVFTAAAALLCNRIFMVLVPLEDIFLWLIRADKPRPNCGYARS